MTIRSFASKHVPWIFSGIGVAVLGGVWALLLALTKQTSLQLLQSLAGYLQSSVCRVLAYFSTPISSPRWLLFALPLLGAVVIILLLAFRLWQRRPRGSDADALFTTTELTVGRTTYRWKWHRYADGTYDLSEPDLFCSTCDCRYIRATCPICTQICEPRLSKDEIHAYVEWQAKQRSLPKPPTPEA